jgi:hypothetical protein
LYHITDKLFCILLAFWWGRFTSEALGDGFDELAFGNSALPGPALDRNFEMNIVGASMCIAYFASSFDPS